MLKGADDESIHIEVSIKGRRTNCKRAWTGYSAAKFLLLFTDDRWDFSPDELAAVAHLATHLGDYPIALEFAVRAADEPLSESINREREAAAAYQDALRFEQAAAWADLLVRTRQMRRDHVGTFFYLLHTNGETPLAKETPIDESAASDK